MKTHRSTIITMSNERAQELGDLLEWCMETLEDHVACAVNSSDPGALDYYKPLLEAAGVTYTNLKKEGDLSAKTSSIPKINPENAEQLWHALFAITLAVEKLQMAVQVNGYRHPEYEVGAWEFARLSLENAKETTDIN